MAESRPVSRFGAVNDGEPYIFHTDPVPIDLYSEGPAGPTWYRIPSWRIEFTCEALKGVDCRVHRGLGHEGQWTLSEASTGFKMFGELPDDHGTAEGMLAEFCAGRMLKLTPELVATSIAKAKEILKEKMPSPFAPRSENRTWIPVSERLPDEKGHYLTVVKGVLDGYIVRSQLYKPNAHKAFSGWIHNPVTHWQPLPEAPK